MSTSRIGWECEGIGGCEHFCEAEDYPFHGSNCPTCGGAMYPVRQNSVRLVRKPRWNYWCNHEFKWVVRHLDGSAIDMEERMIWDPLTFEQFVSLRDRENYHAVEDWIEGVDPLSGRIATILRKSKRGTETC